MECGSSDRVLLTTKLMIPPVYHTGIVPRPRLYRRLDCGAEGPLTLVVAPAGSGKTTLVGEWLRQCEMQAAWVSLEDADNEPPSFWRYIIAALSQLSPALSKTMADHPQSLQREMMLTTLINILMELPQDMVLVLDDYHTITNPGIHRDMQFLLDHLPQRLHLCIITRIELPLSLARLRVQGKVVDIAGNELSFSAEEAECFLTQTMKLRLSTGAIAEIYRRSEGWIAGLQLFARALQGQNDPKVIEKAIQSFCGSQYYVRQYLTDEVLERQPVAVQEFLLATAVLKRLHADLCDAVTGQQNGREMLRLLVACNLFLHPLDEQEQWYRYGTLFAELLRYRLTSMQPTRVSELHRRASGWYERQGLASEALEHALAAGDEERATELTIRLLSQTRQDRTSRLLSEREQEVLRLIAEGKSNREIARILVVTVSTVKTHLNNIYAKLQVHTRLQAVTRAYDLLEHPQNGGAKGKPIMSPPSVSQ